MDESACTSRQDDSGNPGTSTSDIRSGGVASTGSPGFLTPRLIFWFGTGMILAFTGVAAWCFTLPLWYVASLAILDLVLLLLLFLWMECPYDPTAGDG